MLFTTVFLVRPKYLYIIFYQEQLGKHLVSISINLLKPSTVFTCSMCTATVSQERIFLVSSRNMVWRYCDNIGAIIMSFMCICYIYASLNSNCAPLPFEDKHRRLSLEMLTSKL